MVMQVGLKTATSSTAAALSHGAIDAPQSVKTRSITETSAKRNPFPEAALISTRPLRYNVQLNQQLTAIQQADRYLAETETQLLLLRHSSGHRDLSDKASALQRLLDKRAQLSGGTVDRHFSVSLQQNTQVNFAWAGSEKLLQDPGGETLVFSLGGSKRELAAVALPQEATPGQVLMHLNLGLGRLGINARQDMMGRVKFSVDESCWDRISQQLSVKGEGHNFPSDSFTILAVQPEQAQHEGLAHIAARPESVRENNARMQGVLEQITSQRGKLRIHQDRVRSRIDDMATPYTPKQAQDTARALGNILEKSTGSFSGLSRALGAQANLHLATVKNLLA